MKIPSPLKIRNEEENDMVKGEKTCQNRKWGEEETRAKTPINPWDFNSDKLKQMEEQAKQTIEKWEKEYPGKSYMEKLRNDIQKAIDEMPKSKKTITCQKCDKKYVTKTLMQFHECPYCGEVQH